MKLTPAFSRFRQLLDTKYDVPREQEAIGILSEHPELAVWTWPGPDDRGSPFVLGSTALHFAANDGKLELMKRYGDTELKDGVVATWLRQAITPSSTASVIGPVCRRNGSWRSWRWDRHSR